jgi:AraC-like DNA-binding protein
VTEIAFDFGFSDTNSFITSFREFAGPTPPELRRGAV